MESECEVENKVYQYATIYCIVCDMRLWKSIVPMSYHVLAEMVMSLDRAGTVGPVKQSYGSDHASCHVKEHWNYLKVIYFCKLISSLTKASVHFALKET